MMADTKYANGPWAWGYTRHGHDALISPDGTVLAIDAGWTPNEADARLIAAAPDLLAALKVASMQYGAFFVQQYANMDATAHKYHETQLAAIREALDKATGA